MTHTKQIEAEAEQAFTARMDMLPEGADQAAWIVARMAAIGAKCEVYRKHAQALARKVVALENKLDGSAGVRDLCAGDGEHAFFGKLDDSPCLLDVTDEGRVQTVYIAGGWVDADYFADKAHQSWGRQIAAHVEAMQEAA